MIALMHYGAHALMSYGAHPLIAAARALMSYG